MLKTRWPLFSLKNGHDYEFETKFEQKRLSDALMSKGVMQVDSESNTPIPGGVGYGAYFTSDFQSDFTTGTTLFYNIICPSKQVAMLMITSI